MVVTITVIVCGIIIGEAFALLAGTLIIPSKTSNWINWKNAILLIVDILTAVFILISLPELHYLPLEIFLLSLAVGIATHIYRIVQYYSSEKKKFCTNLSLFIVNDIKMLGLIAILAATIIR